MNAGQVARALRSRWSRRRNRRGDVTAAMQALAVRWRERSVEMRRNFDQCEDKTTGFARSCFQRYVDYERRAAELESTLRLASGGDR